MTNDKVDYGEVKIDGRIISSSWWGQMWCKNIENYSNLRNRLERGRTYIRQNTVKNLSISKNCSESLVQGNSKEPYKVTIDIKTIEKSKYENILNTCENSVDNLESLMTGSFPKEYQQFFTNEEYGLFPKSDEINYQCTCLDYQTNMHMCKHIAATMYAIGNKLDCDPLIFFKLRGIDLTEFSKKIVKKENEFVWEKVNSESNRKISKNDISSLFGVDYEENNEEIDVNKLLYSDDNKQVQKINNTEEKKNEIFEMFNDNKVENTDIEDKNRQVLIIDDDSNIINNNNNENLELTTSEMIKDTKNKNIFSRIFGIFNRNGDSNKN